MEGSRGSWSQARHPLLSQGSLTRDIQAGGGQNSALPGEGPIRMPRQGHGAWEG